MAEGLVEEVLEPEPIRPTTPIDRVLEDIDEYVGEAVQDPVCHTPGRRVRACDRGSNTTLVKGIKHCI